MTQNVKLQLGELTARASTFIAAAAIMEQYSYVVSELLKQNQQVEKELASFKDSCACSKPSKVDQSGDKQTDQL